MPLLSPLNPPLPPWPSCRVWVIGASTGIGAALAQALLEAGARVALSARSADKISDVADYGGLPKALSYGASKAALINFTETLYLDVHAKGLGVYLINPGFVKTPLTDKNEFKMPALISAEEAAAATIAGLQAGHFEIHYPHRFTNAMKLLRLLPYRAYFALVRRMTGL